MATSNDATAVVDGEIYVFELPKEIIKRIENTNIVCDLSTRVDQTHKIRSACAETIP